jgi:hypothetical protein
MPSLSDLNRFAHSIAVAYLSTRSRTELDERYQFAIGRDIAIAALLHDAGTAPFGHLFEYALSLHYDWSHITAVSEIIEGNHHPLGRDSQVYFSQVSKISSLLDDIGADKSLIADVVSGRGPFATTISSRLDFDNIDNVYRMALSMGYGSASFDADRAARGLTDYIIDGDVDAFRPVVESWQAARSWVYSRLAFDEIALSSQAVLTDQIFRGLDEGVLGSTSWMMTDGGLLRQLLDHPCTYEGAIRFATGDYYRPVAVLWYRGVERTLDIREPVNSAKLQDAIDPVDGRIATYAFWDNSALSRSVELVDRWGEAHLIGESSQSLIVALSDRRRGDLTSRARSTFIAAAVDALEALGYPAAALEGAIPSRDSLFEVGA